MLYLEDKEQAALSLPWPCLDPFAIDGQNETMPWLAGLHRASKNSSACNSRHLDVEIRLYACLGKGEMLLSFGANDMNGRSDLA